MKTIIVPTDFSDNAKKALVVAAKIAAQTGSKLEIIHINTSVAYAPPLPEYYAVDQIDMTEYDNTAAQELLNLKEELNDISGLEKVAIETRVEDGFLYATLNGVAEEKQAWLIVMGTKGAQGAVEFFVGSNTEKVIRTAPCPVLAVPESAGEFDLKKVVMASTLRPEQTAVFYKLAEWQKHFPFSVQLLYLNNPAGFEDKTNIEQVVREMADMANLKDTTPYLSGNTFDETSSILQFATEHEADLIVMGTHQRQGLSHLLFGSLTEDTANHSQIPVLSIPV
jgi:nucleotide-binding universal stress UspA family protein